MNDTIPHGYQMTEVGVIPEDWEVKTLGELGECIIGLTYSPSNVQSNGTLVLRSSNIGDNHLIYEDNVFVDMDIPNNLIARKGDILICVRNGSRQLIGKCALIDEYAEGMSFGAFMSVFRTELSGFIFFQFQSDLIKKQIEANIGATINQITNKNLKAFKIPLPPTLTEQRAIADALSDVDEQITALDEAITKKRDIKQGAMQRLLTGEERLPGFSGEWKQWSYDELFALLKTGSNPRSHLSNNGDVKYIHYGDIHQRWSTYLDCNKEELPYIDQKRVQSIPYVQDGDLIMADASEDYEGIGASVEISNVGNSKIVAGLHTLLLRGNNELLADGFKGYLQYIPSIKRQLIEIATGISVYGISKTNIKTIIVDLPAIDEQQAIVSILSDIDTEISALEAQREKTIALKTGMMQKLLTGKARLI